MLTCSSCGRENPDGFAFCGYCSARLTDHAARLEERKVVSVLFCDLVGFTATSERQDPEDVRARIRPYYARLRQELERYGATVEKFVGDAVMAIWGAPTAHEDDAERAVRGGLSVLEAIAELNEDDPELALKVRVGINTGEAVVALDARPEHGEGFVTGDVVNTASRIQAVAPVSGVAVGEQTYRATSRVFEYEPLAPVAVKGKSEPLPLWRAKAARARFGSDIAGGFTTPLVGRELEKPLLIGIFQRAAQQRSVQLVTVVGEPGVGKSRLVAELADYVHDQPGLTRWRQGRCLPYGEGITFWALGEIVKAEAGILESDSGEIAAAKLAAAVSGDESERQWLLRRLAPLVGGEAGVPTERDELFAAWRRFLEGLAASRPSVLVFEDLHWADEALLAFLEHLAEWAQGVPLLVVCAARPELYERRPGWGAGQRNAHTVNLSPLSDTETADLVGHLMEATELAPELERAVLERADGNPLYAEEFVRFLMDRGLESGETPLPESLQALIAARLDTLPPDRKALLQDAAVVGKVFWAGAVVEIGQRDQRDVELALHELARKELVRPARSTSMAGEAEYSFWHLLVRDVAYGQIPRSERARRHRAAAAWIERQGEDRVEDLAEVLAHHYVEALELTEAAGDDAQAAELAAPARRFLALAGERALGLDTVQAERRLARAFELTPADDPDRPRLLVRWADAAMQAGRPREAAAALDVALDALLAAEVTEVAAQALQLRSRLALRLGQGTQVPLAVEAVDLLEEREAGPPLVAAYAQLANAQIIAGAHAEGIAAADRACALAQELGLSEPARAVGYRGHGRAYRGDESGLEEMERALKALIEQGAGREAAILQNNLAIARYPLDGPARSLAEVEEGIAFCEARGLAEPAAQLESNLPVLLTELGRPAEALERAARLAVALEARGDTHSLLEVRAVLLATGLARGEQADRAAVDWLVETARQIAAADIAGIGLAAAAAALWAEAPERACGLLVEVEQRAGLRETPYYARQLPRMLRIALAARDHGLAERLVRGLEPLYPLGEHALCVGRAQLAESEGRLDEAVELFAEAATRWREFGHVPERAHARLGQGRCLVGLGRPASEEPLREARDLFAQMGYGPALGRTEALMKAMPAASGA